MKAEVKSVKGLETLARVRDFEMTMDDPKSLGGTNTGMKPVEAIITGDLDTDGFTGKNPDAKIG